jgi:hypothetical protein
MPVKKIIFLSQDRFSTRNYRRFGIQQLIERGFQVEFWECSPIIVPQFFKNYTPPDIVDFSGLKIFHSKKLLLETINDLTDHDVILNLLPFSPTKTWSIFKKISDQNIIWGVYRLAEVPFSSKNHGLGSRIKKFFRNPVDIFDYLFNKIPTSWFQLRPFNFILVGGTAPLPSAYMDRADSNTDMIDIHAHDYDLTLEIKEEPDLKEAIVFLDDGGPLHPDPIITKNKFPCTPEEYFRNLNSFFQMVEKKFGCPVVIAAHPKPNYGEMPNFFEGRKIIYNQTHRLAKRSKFVLATCSTSLNYAVIYRKPIIFLALNPTKKNILDFQISCLASEFRKTPIHWTGKGSVDWDNELIVNKELYSKYLTTYIKKPGSPEKHIWEIFAEYLEGLRGKKLDS